MPKLVRALSLFALSASVATAQATLMTPGPQASLRKLVVQDQGSLWHGALARASTGALWALGNPWLGGGTTELPLTGVNDLTRLDALTPGAAETVATVGSSGLVYVRWNANTLSFDLTSVDANAAGASIVRAAPFAPHHTVVVVPADGMSLRVYRSMQLVGTPSVAGPVRDVEIFRHGSGAARFLLRTDSGLSCTTSAGAVLWTVPGVGGRLVRWPAGSTVRAGWIHQAMAGSPWKLALLGDELASVTTVDLGFAFSHADVLVAAFAVDADHDGDVDLMVKTQGGVSTLVNLLGNFSSLNEVVITPATASPQCVPDLWVTHAGQRLRLVDETGSAGVGWNRVDLPLQFGTSDEGLSLSNDEGTPGGWVFNLDSPPPERTRLRFDLGVTGPALEPFRPTNGQQEVEWAQVQVVVWRQEQANDDARVGLAERIFMFHMEDAHQVFGPSTWRLTLELEQPLTHDHSPLPAGVWGWNDDPVYWLTIRLCKTAANSMSPEMVSEPISLVVAMAAGQFPDFAYARSFCGDDLESVDFDTPSAGGVVVGGIERQIFPPPPPPGGIPMPGSDDHQRTTVQP